MAKSGQHGGNVLQMAEKFHLRPGQITDFSANINPLGMPENLRRTLIEQLDCLQHYPDIEYQKLHQAIAAHHRCPQEWVIAGNGATELIFLWVQHTAPKKALLVEPGFAEYRRALNRAGCAISEFILHEEDDFQVTGRLLDALTGDLDCLFLCAPNNPTGLLPDETLLFKIVKRCQELGIRLFVDESFLDFVPQRQSLSAGMADYPHVYLLRSLTKFYALPGLRLGYLLSSDSGLLKKIREEREPWTINALAALAGEVLFEDKDYPQATYQWLEQEQNHLLTALSQIPSLKVYQPTANYLFFKHLSDQSDLQDRLMEQGILIRSCANYTGLGGGYYRVAIKSRQDNRRLITALQQVLNHG